MHIDGETRKSLDAAAQRLHDLEADVIEIRLDRGTTPDEASAMFTKMHLSAPMGGSLENNDMDPLDKKTPYTAWFVRIPKKGECCGPQAFEFEIRMKKLYAKIAHVYKNATQPLFAGKQLPDFRAGSKQLNFL